MICLLILLLICSPVFGLKYEKFLIEDSSTIARINDGEQVEKRSYAWLIPEKIKPKISLRSPSQGEVTDYLFGVKVVHAVIIAYVEFERENGTNYTNYTISSLHEDKHWQYSGETRRSQARRINRQKASVRRKFFGLGVGVAATSERYDKDAVYGLLDFYLPLGKKGHVGYATNLAGLEIWDVKLYIESGDDSRFKPNIEGKFYKAGRELDWGVSFGLTIKLRGSE